MTSSYQNTLDPDRILDFYSIMVHIVVVWLMASLLIPLMGVPSVVMGEEESEMEARAKKYGGNKEYKDPYGDENYNHKETPRPPYGKIEYPDGTTEKISRSTAGLCPPVTTPKLQICPTPKPCNCPKPKKCEELPKCPPVQKCPRPVTCPTPKCPNPTNPGGGGHGWTTPPPQRPKPVPSGGYGGGGYGWTPPPTTQRPRPVPSGGYGGGGYGSGGYGGGG